MTLPAPPALGLTLASLLDAAPVSPIDDVSAWWADFTSYALDPPSGQAPARSPLLAALRGGGRADRVGWAFAAGYQSALSALIEGRDPSRPAALCVTEQGPPHPRSIASSWDGHHLSGHKRYVTLGALAEVLYVLARTGESGSRPSLVLLEVAADAPGVTLRPGAPIPFVPEVPHSEVRFVQTPARLLEGDGWTRWAKPFRTIEDLYVHAAVLAFLVATVSRFEGPEGLLQRGLAQLAAFSSLAAFDPGAPLTHLALAGALEEVGSLFRAVLELPLPEPHRSRLARDAKLLKVASSAREARRQKAWTTLAPS